MHDSVYRALVDWWERQSPETRSLPVAEVGSRILNGSVRRGIRGDKITGFDVVPGPGVDVVIDPGCVPHEHLRGYGSVVSVSSFQFCPDSELYKSELVDLVGRGGLLFLTMCLPDCTIVHTTSPNDWGWTDHIRMTPEELVAHLAPEFEVSQIRETDHDIIYEGTRTDTAL